MKKFDVVVKNLEEDEQYIIKNVCFPHLNKNSYLGDYLSQFDESSEFYGWRVRDVKIQREVNFLNCEDYKEFTKSLLTDYDFLGGGLGGTYSDDPRLGEYKAVWQIPQEIFKSIKWTTLGIVIKLNDELKFIVNPEGYSYARYCGFINQRVN